MSDILFCLFYLLLFSLFIIGSKWFNADGFSNKHFLLAFYSKLLFGVGLWYIYTHIYKNRVTSDIFKYYDDATVIFGTLHTSIKDYFILLTGIGDSNAHYQSFYHYLNSWDNGYDSILYNNSHFIIRLNAFFLLFSQGHYGVHVIFMCFISLVGLTYIYKAFIPFLQERRKELFAAIFLFPSVILWSSGILKEGLIWFGLGLSIYYFFQTVNTSKLHFKHLLLIVLGFVILYESKAYVLLCLLPCFIAHILIKKNRYCKNHPLITYLVVVLLYMGSSLLPHLLLNKTSPLQMISDKQTDFNRSSRGGVYLENMNDSNNYAFIALTDTTQIIPLNTWADTLLHKKGIQYLVRKPFWAIEFKSRHRAPYMLKKGTPYANIRIGDKDTAHLTATDSTAYWVCIYIETANSRINIEPIKPNIASLFSHIPKAIEVSMLLPYPWQLHSAMTAIYCAENIFVLLLFFIALFFIKRPIPNKDIVLFCLCYCLMMLVLIGLTTPILGGIERYKSVVIPFMFILLLLITGASEKQKMKNEK
jgi:hypothetical protein